MRPWLHVPTDWRRPGAGGPYPLWWCGPCDYGHLWPRPDPADIPAFYDCDYYTHSTDDTRASQTLGILQRVLLALAWRSDHGVEPDEGWWQRLPPEGARRALEIGCGSGSNLQTLAHLGLDVTGVEPDPAACEAARSRGLTVFPGTGEAMPEELAGARYDLVVVSHVLEHCLDPARVLSEVRARLAPGGIAMIEVPNNAAAGLSASGASWPWLDVPRHLNFFTLQSLTAASAVAGLGALRHEWWGYARQFTPGWIRTEVMAAAVFEQAPLPDAAGLQRQVRRQAALLARTLLAPSHRRYDTVRLILAAA